jgi:hypothetical protein
MEWARRLIRAEKLQKNRKFVEPVNADLRRAKRHAGAVTFSRRNFPTILFRLRVARAVSRNHLSHQSNNFNPKR